VTVIRWPALPLVWFGDHRQLLWHTTGSIVCATSGKDSEKSANLIAATYCLLVAITLLCFSCKSYVVNVKHIEYFKLVFLKYINVPAWSIFTGPVTTSTIAFVMCIVISLLIHDKSVWFFKYRMIAEGILDPNCVAPSTLA